MSDNQITYLRIEDIQPHKNNPRKELGDLTELADSIRHNGIMQNLTVVPREAGYTAIIGHRRLAAAKLAGLQEVPCIITDMDEKQQLATMLLENMQRHDLSIYEQAEGFQMMLDMGETAGDIAKKTGFSETTVRKRLFIASNDKEKSKKAFERGASLEDYMKLQQIKSAEKRSKALEHLGTNNFDYNLRRVVQEETRDRIAPKIVKQLKVFAKPTDKQRWELKGYSYYTSYRYSDYDEQNGGIRVSTPNGWTPDEYLYHVQEYVVEVYKRDPNFKPEKKMSELSPEEQEERREQRRKYRALKEMGETAYQLRLAFVRSFSRNSALNAEQFKAISEFAFAILCFGGSATFNDYISLENIQIENPWNLTYSQRKEAVRKVNVSDAKILLESLYCTFKDSGESTYFYGAEASPELRGRHKQNNALDAIYDCLCALGYEMSDDEMALMDGSHELFLEAEE